MLIILATISLNLLMNGNIIGRAEQSKDMQARATELERLELVKGDVAIDNKGKVTVDKYIEEAIKQGITVEDEVTDNEDESKNIITDNGWNVNIAPDPDNENNVIITIKGERNQLPPRITNLRVTESGDTVATIMIQVERAEGATYKYYCKEKGGEYGEPFYEGTDLIKEKAELELKDKEYTIRVKATNEYGSTYREQKIGDVVLSVEEAKKLVTSVDELKKYMGQKVEYKTGEEWRIFYYDVTGYFGPEKTLYLKKTCSVEDSASLQLISDPKPSDESVQLMWQMNPIWKNGPHRTGKDFANDNEKACIWLCDQSIWGTVRNNQYSSYAIGGPSLEMFVRAYNIYKNPQGYEGNSYLYCEVEGSIGYYISSPAHYFMVGGSYRNSIPSGDLSRGPSDVFSSKLTYWLCSPNCFRPGDVYQSSNGGLSWAAATVSTGCFSPVVPLDL